MQTKPTPERVGGGRKPKDPRLVLEGIVFVLRTGCQWKALPSERYGSASAIHARFLEWAQAVFKRLKLNGTKWIEPSEDLFREAVMKIHRTSLQITPTLMKVWMHEWEAMAANRPQEDLQRDADMLRLMCDLLDTPRPPRLIAWHQTPQMH